jgi:anti-sigma-K factor RskA
MSSPRDPEVVGDLLVAWLLGELSVPEAANLERRLAADPELAAEAERLRRTLDLIPFAAATPPPPALRRRVLSAAARGTGWWSWSRSGWRPLAAAAALAALAGLPLLEAMRLRRELEVQREVHELLVQPNVVMSFSMKGTATAPAAFGTVLLDLDAKRAAVAIHRLPPAPDGRVYRLWAEVERRAVFCGQLGPDAGSVVRSQLPIPVESYTAPVRRLYVTLDPEGSPLAPSGPTVLSGT